MAKGIYLLSDRDKKTTSSLCELLHNLNYHVFHSSSDLTGEGSCELPICLTVLFVGDYKAVADFTTSLQNNQNQTRIFVVLDSDQADIDTELRVHSDEYIRWPCDIKLLSAKLSKLIFSTPVETGYLDRCNFGDSHDFIGCSDLFKTTLLSIRKISKSAAPVLITGEVGSGKEAAARTIHNLSSNKQFPFLPIHCGALADELAEEELYGCEISSGRRLVRNTPGILSQAENGTLFLDEIEALPEKAQIALLRYLHDGYYKPVGNTASVQSNIRIIAATKADLSSMCQNNNFREELFFRLNILSLNIPPLRERLADIELLVKHFLNKYSNSYELGAKKINQATMKWMSEYQWPGNVRELQNIIHREYLMSDNVEMNIPEPKPVTEAGEKSAAVINKKISTNERFSKAKANMISEFERGYLTLIMSETNGNVSVAAKRAGKERRAFTRLLKKYDIQREAFCHSS